MTLKLYSFYNSSCAWRVRICLALKKVNYEVVPVSRDTKTNEFFDINPMGQVPALLINDKCLSQSMAMMEYIEEKFTGQRLLPQDLYLRAKVREICELICSGIQPLQNRHALKRCDSECNVELAGKASITYGFKSLEKILQTCSGKYCVGDEITMADACLVPQVFNAYRFQVDMEPFPCICKINNSLEQLDAFQSTHPKNQPDFPKS